MGYRRRIYFTEKQKTEIWDRWQRGETMSSIGRLAKLSSILDENCERIVGSGINRKQHRGARE